MRKVMLGITGLLLAVSLLIIIGCGGGGGNSALKAKYQVEPYCRSRTAYSYGYSEPAPFSTVVRCIEVTPWAAPDITRDSYGYISSASPNQELTSACGLNDFYVTVYDWNCNNVTSNYLGTYTESYGRDASNGGYTSPYIHASLYEYSSDPMTGYGTMVSNGLANVTWDQYGATPDWDVSDGKVLIQVDPSKMNYQYGKLEVGISVPVGTSGESHYDSVYFSGAGAATCLTCTTPTVTAVSPTSGSNTATTTIAITGTGFRADTVFTLGSTTLSCVSSLSATSRSCTVPSGLTPAAYTLTATNPCGAGSLTNAFTVTAPAPTISAISIGGTAVTSGATLVPYDAAYVSIDFSMPMTATVPSTINVSLTNTTASLVVLNGVAAGTLGSVSWLDTDTLKFLISDSRTLTPNNLYSFSITIDPTEILNTYGTALDLAGSSLSTYGLTVSGNTISGTFTTVEAQQPIISAISIGGTTVTSGATLVPYDAAYVAIDFSMPMGATVPSTINVSLTNTTASLVVLNGVAAGTLGSVSWLDTDTLKFLISDSRTLTPNNLYSFSITIDPTEILNTYGTALDLAGSNLTTYGLTVSGNTISGTFTTVEAPQPTINSIMVGNVEITSGSTAVPPDAAGILIGFSEAMTNSEAITATVTLTNTTSGTVTVLSNVNTNTLGEVHWLNSDSTLYFGINDSRYLTPANNYSFSITLNPSQLTSDAYGVQVSLSGSSSFLSAKGITVSGNTLSGTFTAAQPSNPNLMTMVVGGTMIESGSTLVPADATEIIIVFANKMDTSMLPATATITLTNTTSGSVTVLNNAPGSGLGSVTWANDHFLMATITDSRTLTPNNNYSFSVTVNPSEMESVFAQTLVLSNLNGLYGLTVSGNTINGTFSTAP